MDDSLTLDHDNTTAREQAIIEQCVNDRLFFIEVVLGVTLDEWQRKVALALDNGETRISIRSGNGPGKTALLALLILHYILFRNDVKIPVTAPASSQLKDGLIPECHKWMQKLPDFLYKLLESTQDRIVRVDSPTNNFVSFRTARREVPEALAGIHAKSVMCVVDEASAVPEEVYVAAQGTMSTPGSIFIMISNPTRLTGFFYNSHNRLKHRWWCMHVSSFDTTRVDQEFVNSIAETYGIESNQYRVKVLGEFPTSEEETLIPRDLVISAVDREVTPFGPIIWGVDPGRGGDVTALVQRHGNVIDIVKTQNYSDTMQTVGWVKELWDNTDVRLRPETIYVDSIGIGAGVADRLRELSLPCIDINVSEMSSMKALYIRLRDELWFSCKAWFETKTVAIKLNDPVLVDAMVAEISAPLAIFTSTGRNGAESKSQLKARWIKSPNIADALCLTFAYQGAVGAGAASAYRTSWKKPIEYTGAPSVW